MTTTWKQLSRPLRVAIAAPWCLIIGLGSVAAIPATRALLLDSADKPTADVSLASTHWTGTLDAARLPASVPLLSGDQSLSLPGTVIVAGEVYAAGNVYTDGVTITNAVNSNGGDPTIEFDASTGSLKDGGSVALLWDYYGVSIPGSLSAGTINGHGSGIVDPRILARPNVVLVGDSISIAAAPGGFVSWFARMQNQNAYWAQANVSNVAVGGRTTADMLAGYTDEVHPHAPVAEQDGWLFVLGGANDRIGSVTASTAYANLKSIWAQGRADGFKIVAMIPLPFYDGSTFDALHALIRSDPTLYDCLIDFSPRLGGYGGTGPTNYYDTYHPNAAGYAIMAQEVVAQLESRKHVPTAQAVFGEHSPVAGVSRPISMVNPGGSGGGTSTPAGYGVGFDFRLRPDRASLAHLDFVVTDPTNNPTKAVVGLTDGSGAAVDALSIDAGGASFLGTLKTGGPVYVKEVGSPPAGLPGCTVFWPGNDGHLYTTTSAGTTHMLY